MKIGVVSDTHGKFDEALEEVFRGVDLIIHAGDIGKMAVIHRLESIAPVVAVEGNNDAFGRYPAERVEILEGRKVIIRHIFGEVRQLGKSERALIEEQQPVLIIFGHSHKPYKDMLGSTMLFNPGSAGPRRFSLPRTAGLLFLAGDRTEARIVSLG